MNIKQLFIIGIILLSAYLIYVFGVKHVNPAINDAGRSVTQTMNNYKDARAKITDIGRERGEELNQTMSE